MQKRVSIINFKGGVGKTTLTLHLASFLARQSRVLLVDVDHQSSLSIALLRFEEWHDRCWLGKSSVNTVFKEYCDPRSPSTNAEDVLIRNVGLNAQGRLDLLAGSLEVDITELELISTVHRNAARSEVEKRTWLGTWLDRERQSGNMDEYDYVLFDCPPATKLVSQNALAISHAYVMPVVPDFLSQIGASHFRGMVNKLGRNLSEMMRAYPEETPPLYVEEQQLAGVVISNAQTHSAHGYTNDADTAIQSIRHTLGDETVLERVIERGVGVSEALRNHGTVFDFPDNPNVANRGMIEMFEDVCADLKWRIDNV